ncbi:MAG TPA: rod-binding protein [Terriglobales bacterium]|jgi:flagellar protein FlgJ
MNLANISSLSSFMNPAQLAEPTADPQSLSAASQSADPAKIKKVAREFESVLLNSLLGPLQKSFSTLPGDKAEDSTSGQYQSMETQALATALSSAGGLGIANMIVRSVLRSKGSEGLKSPNALPPLGR